jgi:hypothetical protein
MANKHPLPAGNGKSGNIATKKVNLGEAIRGAGDHNDAGRSNGKSWRTLMRVPGKDRK